LLFSFKEFINNIVANTPRARMYSGDAGRHIYVECVHLHERKIAAKMLPMISVHRLKFQKEKC